MNAPERAELAGPAARVAGVALNPSPGWTGVLREQVAAVWLSLRYERMILWGVALFLTLVSVWEQASGGAAGVPFTPRAGIAAAVALLVPLEVWRGEGPARRDYHRAMPLGHGAHAAARSAAGLVWTLAGVAAFFAWLGLLSFATGGGVDEFEAWQWVAPFAGATVVYLLGSAVALVAAHPWRWLGGALSGYLFLDTLRGMGPADTLLNGWDAALTGPYGLTTVLTGLVRDMNYSHREVPDARAWLVGTGLWMALSISLFAWAACRQPER